jgi:hypothetical protein
MKQKVELTVQIDKVGVAFYDEERLYEELYCQLLNKNLEINIVLIDTQSYQLKIKDKLEVKHKIGFNDYTKKLIVEKLLVGLSLNIEEIRIVSYKEMNNH